MYSKAAIFNLSLGALLLNRRVVNPDTDPSNEAKVLLTHWTPAWESTLSDLDLDRTSTQVTLSLVEQNPNNLWTFSYQYPLDCLFFRRIQSTVRMDNANSFIDKRIATKDGKTVIFTNEDLAIGEYISTNVPWSSISSPAAMALSYRLASMAAPLITGKGAKTLKQSLDAQYQLYKIEAQHLDKMENFEYFSPDLESEFVHERTT